jgi:hypothetical protein
VRWRNEWHTSFRLVQSKQLQLASTSRLVGSNPADVIATSRGGNNPARFDRLSSMHAYGGVLEDTTVEAQ